MTRAIFSRVAVGIFGLLAMQNLSSATTLADVNAILTIGGPKTSSQISCHRSGSLDYNDFILAAVLPTDTEYFVIGAQAAGAAMQVYKASANLQKYSLTHSIALDEECTASSSPVGVGPPGVVTMTPIYTWYTTIKIWENPPNQRYLPVTISTFTHSTKLFQMMRPTIAEPSLQSVYILQTSDDSSSVADIVLNTSGVAIPDGPEGFMHIP